MPKKSFSKVRKQAARKAARESAAVPPAAPAASQQPKQGESAAVPPAALAASKQPKQGEPAGQPVKPRFFDDALAAYNAVPLRTRMNRFRQAELEYVRRRLRDMGMVAEANVLQSSERAMIEKVIQADLKRGSEHIFRQITNQVDLSEGIAPDQVDLMNTQMKRMVDILLCREMSDENPDLLDALLLRLSPPIKAGSVYFREQNRYLQELFGPDTHVVDITASYRTGMTTDEMFEGVKDGVWLYFVTRRLSPVDVLNLWKRTFTTHLGRNTEVTADAWIFMQTVTFMPCPLQEFVMPVPGEESPASVRLVLEGLVDLQCLWCYQTMEDKLDKWVRALTTLFFRVKTGVRLPPAKLEGLNRYQVFEALVDKKDLFAFVKEIAQTGWTPEGDHEVLRDPGVFFRCPCKDHMTWRLCEQCYLEHQESPCAFPDSCSRKVKDFEVEYFANDATGKPNEYCDKITDFLKHEFGEDSSGDDDDDGGFDAVGDSDDEDLAHMTKICVRLSLSAAAPAAAGDDDDDAAAAGMAFPSGSG